MAGDFVGVPDELDRLWTPHRMAYINDDDRQGADYDKPTGCPFCRAPKVPDEDALVVARGKAVFALLNLYPYNPGHHERVLVGHLGRPAERAASGLVVVGALS